MYYVFQGLRSLLRLEEVRIDNNIFRLHYKLTMIVLIVFSVINTSRQYIGDPISCITSGIPQNVVNTYCWITATFTLPNAVGKPGVNVIHPGIRTYKEGVDEEKYHKYYQWVCFVLFFQAMLFYIPRYLWKYWEGGKAKVLVKDLKLISIDSEVMEKRCDILCNYFYKNFNYHNMYLVRYVICETLNLINVFGQMFLVDTFLGKEFSTYGWDVITFTEMDQDSRIDPMSKIFPKVAKCTFRKYGSSGTPEKYDNLCILPINVVNEKIYVFLWFWFIILGFLTSLDLFYRLITIMSPRFRGFLLRSKHRHISPQDIEYLCNCFQVGDWFIFYQISYNIDPIALKMFVTKLVACLKKKRKYSSEMYKPGFKVDENV